MPAGDSFNTRHATILLTHIARAAKWLPVDDSNRNEVLRDVAQMESRLALEPLTQHELYRLRQHVAELPGGPFKALLVKQVTELGETVTEVS